MYLLVCSDWLTVTSSGRGQRGHTPAGRGERFTTFSPQPTPVGKHARIENDFDSLPLKNSATKKCVVGERGTKKNKWCFLKQYFTQKKRIIKRGRWRARGGGGGGGGGGGRGGVLWSPRLCVRSSLKL